MAGEPLLAEIVGMVGQANEPALARRRILAITDRDTADRVDRPRDGPHGANWKWRKTHDFFSAIKLNRPSLSVTHS